jgi:ferritin-like metal-binding protein YciE
MAEAPPTEEAEIFKSPGSAGSMPAELYFTLKHQKSMASTASKTTSKKPKSFSSARSKSSSSEKDQSLEGIFKDGLKDIYSAETQLVEALPKMAKAAFSEELQDAFSKHLEETKRHVERLEKIFNRLEIDKSEVESCKAMEGLIEEGNKIIEEYEEGPVRDSALIIGAQKVEHYEIASYGSLCELADVLRFPQIKNLLGRTLDEEEMTDDDLTGIAQEINDEAYEMAQSERGELY